MRLDNKGEKWICSMFDLAMGEDDVLNQKDQDFLDDLFDRVSKYGKHTEVSWAQLAWLNRIADKLGLPTFEEI